jgi:hypothetical protein
MDCLHFLDSPLLIHARETSGGEWAKDADDIPTSAAPGSLWVVTGCRLIPVNQFGGLQALAKPLSLILARSIYRAGVIIHALGTSTMPIGLF